MRVVNASRETKSKNHSVVRRFPYLISEFASSKDIASSRQLVASLSALTALAGQSQIRRRKW